MNAIGRYRIVRPLGEGGMGKIFLGEAAGPSGFARKVVVKVVRDELDAALKQALIDEARLTASLVHRNIVPVLDLEQDGEQRLVILEYVDGLDLRQLIAQTGPLPWELVVFIAAEVAAGLDYAHRQLDGAGRPLSIVHRDVSPANILLSWEGEVKLTDFGVAKFRRTEASSVGLKGNLAYMAPEQVRGAKVGPWTDVFSLGVVMHEALTGKNPMRGKQDMATLAHVRDGKVPRLPDGTAPAGVIDAVARATSRSPDARFPTAAALRDMLLRVPDQPPDPALLLAACLQKLKGGPNVAPDALLEAVLGGGRPVTRALGGSAIGEVREGPPRWLIAAAGALLLVGVALAVMQLQPKPLPLDVTPPTVPAPATPTPVTPTPVTPPVPSGTCRVELRARPPGARILVDGTASGVAPATLELPCRTSPYKLALVLRGHGGWSREVVVNEPAVTVNAALLERGTLSVNAIPWADLLVDGRNVGHTPKMKLVLDAGRHHLKLMTRSGDSRTRVVDVHPGKETKVTVVFAEP